MLAMLTFLNLKIKADTRVGHRLDLYVLIQSTMSNINLHQSFSTIINLFPFEVVSKWPTLPTSCNYGKTLLSPSEFTDSNLCWRT